MTGVTFAADIEAHKGHSLQTALCITFLTKV